MQKKNLFNLIRLSVAAMTTAGIFTAPTQAHAEGPDGWTVWGTLSSNNQVGYYGDASQSGDTSASTDGTTGSAPQTGGTPAPPSPTTNPNPTKIGKDCSENTIESLSQPKTDPKTNTQDPARSLTEVRDKSALMSDLIPANRAQPLVDKKYGAGTWDRMSPAERKAQQSLPCGEWLPNGTVLNGHDLIAVFWVPTDSNGKPALLSDPDAYAVWKTQIGDSGTYGATWKGFVYSLGFTNLANNLSENDAKNFVIFHEYAHFQSPGLDHIGGRRNESTMFNSQGDPISTDGVALLDLAAFKGNTANTTYNQSLTDLANKARIPTPTDSKNSDSGC